MTDPVDPLGSRAKVLLSAYREATAASDTLREGVRGRLERSTKPRRRWVLPMMATLTAAAAAAVLLWAVGPYRAAPTRGEQRDHAAPFVHQRDAQLEHARTRTTGETSTQPDAADDESHAAEHAAEPEDRKAPGETSDARSVVGQRRAERQATRASVGSEVPVEPAPDLAAEMAVLRRASALVRSQEGPRALQALDEHARRFPKGQLVEDREALRVQALCAAGQPEAALQAARAFERVHPASAHLRRVRSSADDCMSE
jgi:hypothetical protein